MGGIHARWVIVLIICDKNDNTMKKILAKKDIYLPIVCKLHVK